MNARPQVLAAVFALLPLLGAQAATCGNSPNDWCTSVADGTCGKHLTADACRKDSACVGLRYSGESVVACHWDERGFADNCPTVGCLPK